MAVARVESGEVGHLLLPTVDVVQAVRGSAGRYDVSKLGAVWPRNQESPPAPGPGLGCTQDGWAPG